MEQARVSAAAIAFFLITTDIGAVEVFRWTDADGVVHYSDEKPAADDAQVTHFTITRSNPLDYDPAGDEYSIRNQAARTNEYYRKIEERREERAKKRAEAAALAAQPPQQFTRIYDAPVRSYFVPLRRPFHPPAMLHKNHHFPNQQHNPRRPFEEPRHDRPPPVPRRPPPGRVAPPPVTPQSIPSRPVRWAPSRHPR
ncbi:MAG: DUF4124 domain-containing protein [Gammaproteobacteria bacterium]|nr:DUF4124 domain-containing protein [Gammaproteobacteria bacterium]